MRCSTNQFISTVMLLVTSFLFSSGADASFFSRSASVDPPGRVARLSYTQGDVSFSPAAAKQSVWVAGRVNRPLVSGDRIWSDSHSRAELQLGSASVRIKDQTSLRIINLNDQIAQFDLSQGTLILHVRNLKSGQTYEIDTPQLAFSVNETGDYRVDVSANGDATTVTVRKGSGNAYAKNTAYKINGAHTYRFTGKNLKSQILVLTSLDAFDKWSMSRDTRVTRSRSVKYVSSNMIGYEDLDSYGNWRYIAGYGYVWSPNHVPAGWAPYRYGHWSWISPWGWTWVDDQPWGFAPSHYGRWAHYRHTWVWIPGPRTVEPTYAPALVVFIGGGKHRIELNSDPAIAWFPLGPQDVYVPPYTVSKTYFNNVNVSNTTINQVQITNVYNNRTTQTNYTNYRITNAITAVPTKSFMRSESTARAGVPVPTTVVSQAPVTPIATITPDQQSMTGTTVTTSKPSEGTLERVPVVITAPPTSTMPVEKIIPLTEVTTAPTVTTDADKAAAEKAKAEKEAADAKAKADKEAADKMEADKQAASEKEKADKAAAEKADADKQAAVEQEKVANEAAQKAETDRQAAAQKEKADQEAAAKAEADKQTAAEKEKADKEAAAAAKAEAEKAAAEQQTAKADADRQAAEKAEAEQAAAAKAEQVAAAKAEAEQHAAERAEAERATAEKAEATAAKVEAERAAAEQASAARAEAERQAAERAEAERAAAAARADAERQAAEQAAAARAEAERQAAERAEAEKAKAEAERAKAEAEKAAAEQAAAAKAETERATAAQAALPPAPAQ